MANYPEKAYGVYETAKDLPCYTPIEATLILARHLDGRMGYVSTSALRQELDTAGLATDADVTALSSSISTLQSQIGTSGSNATQDKFYATNNGNGTNYKVGDDVWIGDVNIANTMQVAGVENFGVGYIKFASGSATPVIGSDGDGKLSVKGGIKFESGSNKTIGTVVLNGANPGTATVSNSLVTASSIIFLTKQTNTNSGNGIVSVTSKGTGTFSITSDHNGDTDVVGYMIVNPA